MTLTELKSHIDQHVDREDFAQLYREYIENFEGTNLPIIFEIKHLAALTGMDIASVAKMTVAQSFH